MRPAVLKAQVQDAVAQVSKAIPLESSTLAQQVDDSLMQERLLATLSTFFGGLALLLAMIGLYGALSYLVTQRQVEFGTAWPVGRPRLPFWVWSCAMFPLYLPVAWQRALAFR